MISNKIEGRTLLITLIEEVTEGKDLPEEGGFGIEEVDKLFEPLDVANVRRPFPEAEKYSDPAVKSMARTFQVIFNRGVNLNAIKAELEGFPMIERIDVPAIRRPMNSKSNII